MVVKKWTETSLAEGKIIDFKAYRLIGCPALNRPYKPHEILPEEKEIIRQEVWTIIPLLKKKINLTRRGSEKLPKVWLV